MTFSIRETVEQRRGYLEIAEDRTPLTKGEIGGERSQQDSVSTQYVRWLRR
jgi:hypothetical protein